MIHYGARPWAIAIEVDPNGQLAETIRGFFPTVEFVTAKQAAELHQSEFDAAILIGSPPTHLEEKLQVLQFGGRPAAEPDAIRHDQGVPEWTQLRATTGVGARNFVLGQAAEQLGVTALVRRTVIPEPGSKYPVLRWTLASGSTSPIPPQGRGITEFAADTTGESLAGYVRRSGADGSGHLWWLPDTAEREAVQWMTTAARWWQQFDEGTFPPVATWTEQQEWMTHDEALAADAIDRLNTEAEEFRLNHEARLMEATKVQEAAQAAAAAGSRRLLTGQGDDLIEAVLETLRLLGFSVVDSDRLGENAKFKQEDLRISDGDWICLAEVKGHKKGAKSTDLQQLHKAVEVYVDRGNPRPAARWYVVNHNFQTPPGLRDAPLAGAPEIPVFASMGGAVLDTRVLYAMRRSVEAGDLTPEAARAKLKQASGVYPINE